MEVRRRAGRVFVLASSLTARDPARVSSELRLELVKVGHELWWHLEDARRWSLAQGRLEQFEEACIRLRVNPIGEYSSWDVQASDDELDVSSAVLPIVHGPMRGRTHEGWTDTVPRSESERLQLSACAPGHVASLVDPQTGGFRCPFCGHLTRPGCMADVADHVNGKHRQACIVEYRSMMMSLTDSRRIFVSDTCSRPGLRGCRFPLP